MLNTLARSLGFVIAVVTACAVGFIAQPAAGMPAMRALASPALAPASPMRAPAELAPPFLLGPPSDAKPLVVTVQFMLQDINQIDDELESFEFSGVMTTVWRDPRQAFDPAIDCVQEKVFQGSFQFNEISPGWYPQIVIVNESGLFQKSGVTVRVQPDGTTTLIETINASAKCEFSMRRFPFDAHQLEAVFEVLGFDNREVELRVTGSDALATSGSVAVPQWRIGAAALVPRERAAQYAGPRHVASTVVLSIHVERDPFFIMRLVVAPLVVIVLLSFSVFWMDRSSLGDRLSVSFIGILTGVAYQLVMSENLPRISYVTLMHGFLNLSFLTMCATVVVNLMVGALDKKGKYELGDRIDRLCRWGFPVAYFGLGAVMIWVTFTFF